MRITNQVQRLHYCVKHARSFLPYLTAKKVGNLALNFAEMSLRVVAPRSLPPCIKIEPTAVCQLRCPGCWHGDPSVKQILNASGRIRLQEFKKIVDQIADTTLGISLSFRGEPLLNRELTEIIRYAHARKIATTLPTNLSMPIDAELAERLITSGLDTLFVSLDGASAETYGQYRQGGDFDRVVANVEMLAAARKRLRNFHTRLIWKMVIFDHNRCDMEAQATTYRDLGFDNYVRVIDRHSAEALSIADRQNRKMVENRSACFWLWNTMVIASKGEVYPCCNGEEFELGNAIEKGVRTVWRGPAYQALRLAFTTRTYGKDMHPVCSKCIGLETRPLAAAQLVTLETISGR